MLRSKDIEGGASPAQAASTCSWTATANVPWITFNSGVQGKGNGALTFTVGANTGAARSGLVTVNGTNVFINQGAGK